MEAQTEAPDRLASQGCPLGDAKLNAERCQAVPREVLTDCVKSGGVAENGWL